MIKKVSIVTSILCTCLFSAVAHGATLSVGDGQTYADITSAYAAAVTGDTISIHEGIYNGADISLSVGGSGKNDITFQRFENDKVVLVSMTVNYGSTGFIFDGLIFVASGIDSQVLVNATDVTWKNDIFYSNLQATKGLGIQFGYGAHRQTVENCTFFDENGWGIWSDGVANTLAVKDSLFVSNDGTATRFGSGGISTSTAVPVEYSAFWNNTSDVGGLTTVGTGSLTNVEVTFASTDIGDPYFGYLADGTPDSIALGDSDGSYMGARGFVPAPPSLLEGDANRDDVVSAGDYASVQSHFGETGIPGILGDANGDGVVSAGDYASVQANFGNVAAPVEAIPEPASMSILSLGIIALVKRRM